MCLASAASPSYPPTPRGAPPRTDADGRGLCFPNSFRATTSAVNDLADAAASSGGESPTPGPAAAPGPQTLQALLTQTTPRVGVCQDKDGVWKFVRIDANEKSFELCTTEPWYVPHHDALTALAAQHAAPGNGLIHVDDADKVIVERRGKSGGFPATKVSYRAQDHPMCKACSSAFSLGLKNRTERPSKAARATLVLGLLALDDPGLLGRCREWTSPILGPPCLFCVASPLAPVDSQCTNRWTRPL